MKFFKKTILSTAIISALTFSSLLQASEEIPTQEEVAKLYVATFNRAPDSAGLTYWTTNSGLPLSGIAQSFFEQPETKALYPTTTANTDFISSVYSNLFNRQPDTAGLNYWEGELNNGNISKDRFIQAVINGAKNTATSNDADILSNKTTVGLSFSEAGKTDVDEAKSIMNGISDDDTTMTSAVTKFGISLHVASSTSYMLKISDISEHTLVTSNSTTAFSSDYTFVNTKPDGLITLGIWSITDGKIKIQYSDTPNPEYWAFTELPKTGATLTRTKDGEAEESGAITSFETSPTTTLDTQLSTLPRSSAYIKGSILFDYDFSEAGKGDWIIQGGGVPYLTLDSFIEKASYNANGNFNIFDKIGEKSLGFATGSAGKRSGLLSIDIPKYDSDNKLIGYTISSSNAGTWELLNLYNEKVLIVNPTVAPFIQTGDGIMFRMIDGAVYRGGWWQ